MADNNTDELNENSIANLVNAEAKLERQDIESQLENSSQEELSAIQQSTAELEANTQAQKDNNEEKKKAIEMDKLISSLYEKTDLTEKEKIAKYSSEAALYMKMNAKRGNLTDTGYPQDASVVSTINSIPDTQADSIEYIKAKQRSELKNILDLTLDDDTDASGIANGFQKVIDSIFIKEFDKMAKKIEKSGISDIKAATVRSDLSASYARKRNELSNSPEFLDKIADGANIYKELAKAIKESNDAAKESIQTYKEIEKQDKEKAKNNSKSEIEKANAKAKKENAAKIEQDSIDSYKKLLSNTGNSKIKGLEDIFKVSEDDKNIRNLRLLISDFQKIQSYIDNIQKDPLRAFSEKGLISKFNESKEGIGHFSYTNSEGIDVEGTGLSDRFEKARENLISLLSAINDQSKSDEERLDIIQKSQPIIDEYNESLKKLTDAYTEVNNKTNNAVKGEKAKDRTAVEKHDANSDGFYGKKNYNYWKYAWRRNADQQKDFIESGELPSNFLTTGNFRDSFAKTTFNKSVGYRQRQGLVGLAANIGYNASGVGLSLGLGAFATALTKGTQAVINFAKESTIAYGEIQSIKTNLGIVSGSQAEADQTFSEIAEYSIKSPFGVQTVSEFAVLLKQSGVYASDLMDTLKQIGDVAGGNQEKFGNIANAFSQIEANGKATTRQLRQFATAGIPVYKELSKELGVGIDQIRKMTEQGQISSQIIEKVFSNMTGAGGTFENAVNIGAKTWKARQQNLADAKQLAQSAVGEYLINFGGTGRNDSIAETVLSIKESFYQFINDFATVKNIDNNVGKIAAQDTEVNRLTKELEILEKGGASKEVIQLKKDEIKAAATYISDDMQRAYAKTAYETAMSKYEGKQELSDEAYKDLNKTIKSIKEQYEGLFISKDSNGNDFVAMRDENNGEIYNANVNIKKYRTVMATLADLEYEINNSYRKSDRDKDFNKVSDLIGKTNVANALDKLSKGFETLDKSINKNPYNPKNKTGLYAMNQESISKYNQTEEGKKKLEAEEEANWEMMRGVWDNYAQYINESGKLMKNFTGTAAEALEMMTSGIITPLEEIELAPEKIATDWIGLTNLDSTSRYEEEKKRTEVFNEGIDNFENTSVSIMKFGDTTDTVRQIMLRFMSDIGLARQMGATTNSVEFIDRAFNNTVSDLNKAGATDAAEILATALTRTTRTGKADPWSKINTKSNAKDTYPLWQRILNQSFGTSLELFKNGAITRGDQAVNLWATQQKREGIKNVSRSMLNTMNYKDVMSNLAYSGGNYVIGNTSKIGVTQIDWDKTYKNFSTFSMSLESAAEVTRAYSDSLQSDVDTLRDFMSSAFTITEDAANVYDSEYQKHLGDLSKNIKALDANAYDMMFEVDDSGMIKLRENATSAAQALLEEKETMLTFADSVATAKESIKQMNDEIRATSISRDINLGAYDNYDKMRSLTSDEKSKLITFLSSEFNNEKWTALLDKYNISSEQAIKSYLTDNKFIGSIDNTSYEKKEKLESNLKIAEEKLKDITPKMIEAFIEANTNNKNAKLESELTDVDRAWLNAVKNNDTEYMTNVALKFGGNAGSNRYSEEYSATINSVNDLTRQLSELGDVSEQTSLSFDDLYNSFDEYLNKVRESYKTERQEMFSRGFKNLALSNIDEGKVGEDYLRSIWAGDSVSKGNTLKQQRILDYIGIEKGYTFDDAFNSTFETEAGKSFIKSFMSSFSAVDISKYRGKDEFVSGLASGYKDYMSLTGNDINPDSIKETIEALVDSDNIDSIKSLFEYLAGIKEQVDLLTNTFSDLGKTIKDTFINSLEQGFANTFVTMGNHVRDLVSYTGEAVDSAKDYADIWKNVAQEMLSSLGPAMTQAGLSLLMKGQIGPGMALVAAGGVLSFMSGLFGEDENRSKDEENRIKTLKDLLADLIEQAKTDAQYYEKNFKHENAISEANKISVNDAIITPNGNVVSTHPDDYLIATKTPGSLIGAGSKGDTVVNFTMIDQSGKGVNVKTEQKENEDGSVDIIAIVTDAVGQAIADGTMDGAFAARDMRMNGNTYAY